jgi:hypothetical protein
VENPYHFHKAMQQSDTENERNLSRLYVQEFANYVLAEKSPCVVLKTEAHCVQLHLNPSGFKDRWIANGPYGYVLLYPDWLAFFTESKQILGRVSESWFNLKQGLETWKYAVRFDTVGSVIRMAYTLLTSNEREEIKKFIANPNSIFIPLNTVLSAEQIRSKIILTGLKVKTTEGRKFIFAPNIGLALPGPRFWKAMWATYGGTWEPKIQTALQEAIKRNRGG